MHGVTAGFQNERLEEKQLEERLKGLQIDMQNIAKVISANTGKTVEEVNQAMIDRTTLSPDQAKDWGLVHKIESELFDEGTEVVSIQSA
ncbi:MAG: ATP-dependent Clp protease proteolytic subunit [Acidobacteria bacterium]|nr:ATP-dependent Clp protease proteolytic subunit [Acidobacteriota bacterium]